MEGGGGCDGTPCEDWLGPPRASSSRRKRAISSSYLENLSFDKSETWAGRILLLHAHVSLLELEDFAAHQLHFLDLASDCIVEINVSGFSMMGRRTACAVRYHDGLQFSGDGMAVEVRGRLQDRLCRRLANNDTEMMLRM